MLLNPMVCAVPSFMAPKRLETFWMGCPSVFHTAPPHPRSNAHWIWAPELVGGADASQNGFGERMPAQFADRSAMAPSHQVLVDGLGGALALGRGVDDLGSSVGAVAAGEPSLAPGGAVLADD